MTINEYNGLNQLIKVTKDDKISEYTYNAEGLRTSKTVNGIVSKHIFDGSFMIADDNQSTAKTNFYLYGKGLVSSYNGTTGEELYYQTNLHGDVDALIKTDGSVKKRYTYDAFGVEQNMDPQDTNPFRYSGEFYDKETGNIYLRARYYTPNEGRFLTEDSVTGKLDVAQSLNLYTYCEEEPVGNVDPTGHETAPITIKSAESIKKVQTKESSSQTLTILLDFVPIVGEVKLVSEFVAGKDAVTGQKIDRRFIVLGVAGGKIASNLVEEALKHSDGVVKCIGEFGCFTEETLIPTNEGYKEISDIKVGDLVHSENPETGEKGFKKVKTIFVHDADQLMHVFTSKEHIKATLNHPFWVEGKGWVPARDLKLGDHIRLYDGSKALVSNLYLEKLSKIIKVYNFEVEDWHTYFVSKAEVLVHNTCPKIEINVKIDSKTKLLTNTMDVADHHIIPKFRGNSKKYADFISKRGIDVDDFTITIAHGKASQHLKFIHGEGKWNQRWMDWIDKHPNATAKDIYQFAGQMMDDFGLADLKIHPYKK